MPENSEQTFSSPYFNQSEQQKSLVIERYLFGLSRIEILLEEKEKINWVDIGSNIGLGLTEISDKTNLIASDVEIRYLKSFSNTSETKVCLDGTELPFPNASCDVISCFEAIEHFPIKKIVNLLEEVDRVLKPDGIFLLSTPNKDANGSMKMSKEHFQEFSSPELLMILNRYGFYLEEYYGQNFIQNNSRLHQLFIFLRENPIVRHLYEKLPKKIILQIRDKSLKCFGSSEIREKHTGETERIMYFLCKKDLD